MSAKVFSADQSGLIYIEYGTTSGVYTAQTATSALASGVPLMITLSGLSANTQYFYRLEFQATGESGYSPSAEHTFHTARPVGSTFTFTIQADSHLDENSNLDL